MKCPYAVDRRTVMQTSFEYNEEGAEVFRQTVENNTASFVECLREECGAWQDGRCRYRGVE